MLMSMSASFNLVILNSMTLYRFIPVHVRVHKVSQYRALDITQVLQDVSARGPVNSLC